MDHFIRFVEITPCIQLTLRGIRIGTIMEHNKTNGYQSLKLTTIFFIEF
jgi:hypothetical protein